MPIIATADCYTLLVLLSEGRFVFVECRDYIPDCREDESSGSWHLESGELVLEIKKKIEVKGSVGLADPEGYLGESMETCIYPDEPPHVVEVSPAQERRFTYQLFEDSRVELLSMKLSGAQYWRIPGPIESSCPYIFLKPRECAP